MVQAAFNWANPLFNSPMHRTDDHETSVEAAETASFKINEKRLLVLQLLLQHGAMTDYELAAKSGMQQNSIGKRRSECYQAGLVECVMGADGKYVKRSTPSGSKSLAWQLTPYGRTYVEGHTE